MSQPNQRKKTGRDTVYDEAFKIAVATEYLRGALGYKKLAIKHKLKSSTVSYFVKWHSKHFADSGAATTPPHTIQIPDHASTAPAADKDRLQRQLEDALLKVEALETLIAIANKDLGIDILKNTGARQSKP